MGHGRGSSFGDRRRTPAWTIRTRGWFPTGIVAGATTASGPPCAAGAGQTADVSALTYPEALAATVAIEVPVWATLLVATHGIRWRRALGIGVLVNVVSHPIFWFGIYPALSSRLESVDQWVALALSEGIVVLAEAAVAGACLGRVRADGDAVTPQPGLLLAIAVAANLVSYGAGVLLQQ